MTTLKHKDRRHPLQRLLFPIEHDYAVVRNTQQAIRSLPPTLWSWLEDLRPRLLSVDKHNDASSALAEIRACGYLFQSGLSVQPVKKEKSSSTPEFHLEGEEQKIIVEVYSKQASDIELQRLENFNNEEIKFKPSEPIVVREYPYVPFGEPRIDESITLKAICKVARAKRKEEKENKQFSKYDPNILWLDYQDEIWQLVLSEKEIMPLSNLQGQFYSGVIWYAFYGWKDAPVFEGHTCERRIKNPPVQMPQNGRFLASKKLSAAIISFPESTFLFENPFSENPIRDWLWRKLLLLPRFNYEMSYINWPAANLIRRYELDRERLIALSSEAVYSW